MQTRLLSGNSGNVALLFDNGQVVASSAEPLKYSSSRKERKWRRWQPKGEQEAD